MMSQARGIVTWWGRMACLFLAINAVAKAESSVYLALGDSITFGIGSDDPPTVSSNGDRGYVSLYANYLASQAGGIRPTVINLAVTGETSSSFFGNGVGLNGAGASSLNTNYQGSPLASQDALMLTTIKNELAAGNTISNVTISLGANDLYYALATNQSPAAVLPTFQANETLVLGQIRAMLPGAQISVLSYYDPYAPFANDPSSPNYPFAAVSGQAIPLLNSFIAADAKAIGAYYVDTYPLFVGRELADTYISTGNPHPTPEGYQLIAAAVESVPEPSSVVSVGLGGGILALAGLMRQRRSRLLAAP